MPVGRHMICPVGRVGHALICIPLSSASQARRTTKSACQSQKLKEHFPPNLIHLHAMSIVRVRLRILRCRLSTNHVSIAIVSKKKKLKKFTATSAVKAASRAVLGTPPPVKRVENKKYIKKDKHKPSLGKLLADAERG